MGRKSTPTKLKKIMGNPGKHKLNENEPQPSTDMPRPPAWLDPYALKVWKYHARELNRIGVLTVTDRDTFAAYCQSVSNYRAACLRIRKEGLVIPGKDGIPKRNPACIIQNAALKNILSYGSEFGMSPSSRSRIVAFKKKPDNDRKRKGKLSLI